MQVLDIRKVNHDKKDMFSLVGLSTTKEDLFAHRPYHSKVLPAPNQCSSPLSNYLQSELWGTGRSIFAKYVSFAILLFYCFSSFILGFQVKESHMCVWNFGLIRQRCKYLLIHLQRHIILMLVSEDML